MTFICTKDEASHKIWERTDFAGKTVGIALTAGGLRVSIYAVGDKEPVVLLDGAETRDLICRICRQARMVVLLDLKAALDRWSLPRGRFFDAGLAVRLLDSNEKNPTAYTVSRSPALLSPTGIASRNPAAG